MSNSTASHAQSVQSWLGLRASSPGSWANGRLSCTVKRLDSAALPGSLRQRLQDLELDAASLVFFSLGVKFKPGPGKLERSEDYGYLCASERGGPYRVDRVLKTNSQLVAAVDGLDFGALEQGLAARFTAAEVGFDNGADGGPLSTADYVGSEAGRTGMYALEDVDLFNLLCIPPDTREPSARPTDQAGWNNTQGQIYGEALRYCRKRRAMLLVDAPAFWAGRVTAATVEKEIDDCLMGLGGQSAANAAVYFPWLKRPNAERYNEIEEFPPCGAVAGVMARTDATRGVWKTPAGTDASVEGAGSLQIELTDAQNGQINLLGVNCLRSFPLMGTVVWGGRTMRGAELLASEWKYVSVRRLTLYIEESLSRGTKWAVFEPNDENLWSSLRTAITSFMQDLKRQGAFYDFFVKCDAKTTTPADRDAGVVNVIIGFAPVKPAEFIILYFQQQSAKE